MQMTAPRVHADLQNLDDENRLRLNCAGTRQDLEWQGIELREGMVLTLYTDDANDEGLPDELLAEGIVHYSDTEKCWVAAIDWQGISHASKKPGFAAIGTNFSGARPDLDNLDAQHDKGTL